MGLKVEENSTGLTSELWEGHSRSLMLTSLDVFGTPKREPHFYSSKHTCCYCDQIAHLTIKLFTRKRLACSFESEGANFGAGASFLIDILSVHSDVRLGSMWTVMLVYQHLPVYGRFKLWLVPGCFWTSKPMSSHLRMKVWVFFQTLELIILKSAVRNGFKDLPNLCKSTVLHLSSSLSFL